MSVLEAGKVPDAGPDPGAQVRFAATVVDGVINDRARERAKDFRRALLRPPE